MIDYSFYDSYDPSMDYRIFVRQAVQKAKIYTNQFIQILYTDYAVKVIYGNKGFYIAKHESAEIIPSDAEELKTEIDIIRYLIEKNEETLYMGSNGSKIQL